MPDVGSNGCVVVVDRGAVANGDDGIDHREAWVFPALATTTDLLVELARRFFPNMGMWLVYLEGDTERRHLLGIVNYDRGPVRNPEGPLLTPMMEHVRLSELPGIFRLSSGSLAVCGDYRSGIYSQLVTLEEIKNAQGYTGSTPTGRSWLGWIREVENSLGYNANGDMSHDGYSMSSFEMMWKAGWTSQAAVEAVWAGRPLR